MVNKHKTRESGTKTVIWARSEPGTVRFYVDSGWAGTNKRVGLEQKTKHGGLARHGPFTSKPVKPAFCTKLCLPGRLVRFFRVYQVGRSRLGPLRAVLGQGNESTGLDDSVQFSNHVWRAGPKRAELHRARAEPGGRFGHL
jgi:hypothetical protein